jgi:hypothetical protein
MQRVADLPDQGLIAPARGAFNTINRTKRFHADHAPATQPEIKQRLRPPA